MMEKNQDAPQVHCYTNPSFCKQSEYIPEDGDNDDLPPPPQFQHDNSPALVELHESHLQYGLSNPAFLNSPDAERNNEKQYLNHSIVNLDHTNADRYCYIDDSIDKQSSPSSSISHKRYGSLPITAPDRRPYLCKINRYEYIQDGIQDSVHPQKLQQEQYPDVQNHQQLQQQQQQQQQQITAIANNMPMYEFINQQQIQQNAVPVQQKMQLQQQVMIRSEQNSVRASVKLNNGIENHFTTLNAEEYKTQQVQWENEGVDSRWNISRKQISTPRGRYTSLPMHDEDPPSLPQRNLQEVNPSQRVNNVATQKLHEILTTPRKPKTRSQSDMLLPAKSIEHQQQPEVIPQNITPTRRNTFAPGYLSSSSGSGYQTAKSPVQPQQQHQLQLQYQNTPHSRNTSPRKKGAISSNPTKEVPTARRCLPLNTEPVSSIEPSLHNHIDDNQGAYTTYSERPRKVPITASFYQGVEGAFIARTAVVPPLSPSMSETNTTLVSGTEKIDRKNAPLILFLVGILTCGLASYLSWTQGRRYYFDSAIGCGACCALAGACRSMRRTWTGLGLAGLAALSCAGLLLLAAKSPRPGTPLHDVTAGALCGVSLLGALLALLALIAPKCYVGRHRRVHSWIPSFSH